MTSLIPPGERRELRYVVRQQFRVLRTEVKQRETELLAEAERRLVDKYRDEDKTVEDTNWKIREIGRDAQRQIDDLLRAAGEDLEAGGGWRFSRTVQVPQVHRKSEDKSQLHRALVAGIKDQVAQATLSLDRQEADLLRSLAMEALESEEARAFLGRIPTVAELVPTTRLREIEAAFDSGTTDAPAFGALPGEGRAPPMGRRGAAMTTPPAATTPRITGSAATEVTWPSGASPSDYPTESVGIIWLERRPA